MNELNISQLQSIMSTTDISTSNENTLILSIVFGVIGMFYYSVGKKVDDKVIFYYCGIGLMLFPYFVDGQTNVTLMGLTLIALPFIMKKLRNL